jgi:hypothetical protein
MRAEFALPARQNAGAARQAEGFVISLVRLKQRILVTPKQDKKPQCARILPKRGIPFGRYIIEAIDKK